MLGGAKLGKLAIKRLHCSSDAILGLLKNNLVYLRMVALVKFLPVKNSRTALTIQFRCCCLPTKKGVPIRIQFLVFITTTAGENDVAKVVVPN